MILTLSSEKETKYNIEMDFRKMVVEDGILLHLTWESNMLPSFVVVDLRVLSLLREVRENRRHSSY